MSITNRITQALLPGIITCLLFVTGCQEPAPDTGLATVTTNEATAVGDTSVIIGGNVASNGGSPVTEYGIAINVVPNPTVDVVGLAMGSGNGPFSDILEGLDPNTTYYVRAYATNSIGTAYGNEISFTTTGLGGGGCITKYINALYLTTPTTWYKDTVYILSGNCIINADLTIQPGTIIKFEQNGTIYNSGNAAVNAIGTASEPIIFTAYTDDSYCGDNNGDGNATVPTRGYWGGISVQATVQSNFTYCSFLYCGANTANGANRDQAMSISSYSDGSVIDHCTFAHTSGGTDPDYAAVEFRTDVFNVTFTNNILYDNGAPVVFKTPSSAGIAGPSNIFYNPAHPLEKNVLQAVAIKANQTFNANTTLALTGIPYRFYYSSIVNISSGVQVIVDDNVVIKFDEGQQAYMYSSGGKGFVCNQNSVLFTSLKDDTGGDSNGDGGGTSPADNDWEGIYDADLSGSDKWLHWDGIKYSAH